MFVLLTRGQHPGKKEYPFLFLDVVQGHVFGDGKDERLEIILGFVFADGFVNLEKHVLGKALGFVVIENHLVDKIDDFSFIAVYKNLEVPGIALPDRAHHIVVRENHIIIIHVSVILIVTCYRYYYIGSDTKFKQFKKKNLALNGDIIFLVP